MCCVIIIVNFRTPKLVYDCLHSLWGEVQSTRSQVVVVDNNSADGSVEYLVAEIQRQGWGPWVSLLAQDCNKGFAAGNNAAIQFTLAHQKPPDYMMLLNPDTIIHAGAVKRMISFMDKHSNVGIVGAQLENEFRVPGSSARRYPSILGELDNGARLGMLSDLLKHWRVSLPVAGSAHRCDWVSGAAMMIRLKVIEQIGLMDEGFFLYFEEVDFCHRAHNAGWQIWLEPAALVTHLEGSATNIKQHRKRRGQYWFDSRRRYFIKHQGIPRWILADLLWAAGRLSLKARIFFKMGGETSGDPLYFFRDLIWGDLRAIINGEARQIALSTKKHIPF